MLSMLARDVYDCLAAIVYGLAVNEYGSEMLEADLWRFFPLFPLWLTLIFVPLLFLPFSLILLDFL